MGNRTMHHLTLAEQALAEKKRAKRREKKQQETLSEINEKPAFLARPWISLLESPGLSNETSTVKVMTWNILAQCLVRSDLFPTSGKARKAGERGRMIQEELLHYNADIICLQEVDRLEKLLPLLGGAGYSCTYAAGPEKSHGCLIAYKQILFRKVDEKVIQFDDIILRDDVTASSWARAGSSHRTRNIASLVALEWIGSEGKGYVIATTHLFWHPAYTYERTRQAGILLRETIAWRNASLHDWPCIITGDFNFSPEDPAYSLVVGDQLSEEQKCHLDASRVIHVSIDSTIPKSMNAEAEEGEEADPDRVIRDSRVALPSDGLLSDIELSELFPHHVRSAYDEGQRARRGASTKSGVLAFGDRMSFYTARLGACEPMWTSYTHFWKATLDYVFFLDSSHSQTQVTGYLHPHKAEDVALGLPQAQICGSDHFSLCAQLNTSRN